RHGVVPGRAPARPKGRRVARIRESALLICRCRTMCLFRRVPILRDYFREVPDTRPQWVRPTLVVEVEYRQRLKDGLRHAALKGLRPEKKPGTIRRSPMPKSSLRGTSPLTRGTCRQTLEGHWPTFPAWL